MPKENTYCSQCEKKVYRRELCRTHYAIELAKENKPKKYKELQTYTTDNLITAAILMTQGFAVKESRCIDIVKSRFDFNFEDYTGKLTTTANKIENKDIKTDPFEFYANMSSLKNYLWEQRKKNNNETTQSY